MRRGCEPALLATLLTALLGVSLGGHGGSALGGATVFSAYPNRGHHQGGTPVSIFGSGFTFNASSASGIRCCWDHHPGYLSSQLIEDSRVVGGDGVIDEETVPTFLSDGLVVCPSYASVPGYTHTDDLLLAFAPRCGGHRSTMPLFMTTPHLSAHHLCPRALCRCAAAPSRSCSTPTSTSNSTWTRRTCSSWWSRREVVRSRATRACD